MEKFYELYFERDKLSTGEDQDDDDGNDEEDVINTIPFLSEDGQTCSRYIRILAETCQAKSLKQSVIE